MVRVRMENDRDVIIGVKLEVNLLNADLTDSQRAELASQIGVSLGGQPVIANRHSVSVYVNPRYIEASRSRITRAVNDFLATQHLGSEVGVRNL